MRYEIFLSYSHRDAEWATQLHRRLRRFRLAGRPLRIFFAPAAITAGESIPRALSEALDDSQHLVMLLSPAWIASEWCRLEGEVAMWRDPSAEHRVLLPLLLKNCTLPSALRRLRYIDFRLQPDYESSLREVVNAIRSNVRRYNEGFSAAQEQNAVLNEPILPWLGFGGPSFDFLWPEMIIDPFVRMRKHPGPERRLSNWINAGATFKASSIAIVGEPGVGKTTALRTLLLAGGAILPQRRVFLHARDLNTSLPSLLRRSDDDANDLGVIVDGLDEAGIDRIAEIVSALSELQRPNVAVVVASRIDFFDRQYDVLRSGLANLTEILELSNWRDDEIVDFTSRYAERIDEPSLSSAVRRILEDVPGARAMLGNPMRLTLLLYLLATGARIDMVNLQEPYSLYSTFYREWIKKERSRGTGGFSPNSIRVAHTEAAHWLYEHKGETTDLNALMNELSLDADLELISDSAFYGLLTLDEDDSDEPVLVSFRHETIGEFLLARDILESFSQDTERLDSALRTTVADDVNTFVRSGMLVASRSMIKRYLSNLSARYKEQLAAVAEAPPSSLVHQQSERLREQILYYIGRLPVETFPNILRWAFRNEDQALLRRAAALGAVLQGDLSIEREYISSLDDPEQARLNRSVQMVYFGDVHDDLHTFQDTGQDWARTRAAIYRRLCSSLRRDIALRWWDIRTLRSFYESRDFSDTLTDSELATLRDVALDDPSSPDRSAALRAEYEALVRALGLDEQV